MAAVHIQDEIHARSIKDPEGFWMYHASQLHWHTKPYRALHTSTKRLKDDTTHSSWSWFPGGEISNCYNCVDRHVQAGYGNAVAIVWDSPVTGSKGKFTYSQLLEEVETLAGVLKEEGVRKGDVVLIYSMIVRKENHGHHHGS
jgi:propionyl-CoA synthetase